jgi:hypothetical protein
MVMPVVQIRIVRVFVSERRMAMPMCVGFAGWVTQAVLVLVMGVVNVAMLVLDGFVLMLMCVHFRQMQIQSNAH